MGEVNIPDDYLMKLFKSEPELYKLVDSISITDRDLCVIFYSKSDEYARIGECLKKDFHDLRILEKGYNNTRECYYLKLASRHLIGLLRIVDTSLNQIRGGNLL